jgi:hypothetical protein
VDLDKLWQELGVSRQGGFATFNDQAPLAQVREAINSGKPGKPVKVNVSLDNLMSVGRTD